MDQLQSALETYFSEWHEWVQHQHTYDFASLKPMHAGWKVPDENALGSLMAQMLQFTQQGHIGTVDDRKIALLVLKQPVENVPVLQAMQLRPGSTDTLGLDHVAFYCSGMANLQEALEASPEKWEHQENPGHQWISMWFGPNKREVKFFDHTSLDLGARELEQASATIKA